MTPCGRWGCSARRTAPACSGSRARASIPDGLRGCMISSPSALPSTFATAPPPLPRPAACSSPANGSSASGTTGICGTPCSRPSKTSSGRPSPNTVTARAARIRPTSSARPACSRTSPPSRAKWEHAQTPAEIVEAWRSHSTLHRQAGDKFAAIIEKIEQYLAGLGRARDHRHPLYDAGLAGSPRGLSGMTAQTGRVFWITGLSGAGKSTLARALQARLPQSILLDGDELRAVLGATASGFDRQSRLELARTYARLCGLLAGQGHTVIMATISLFHEIHAWNRENLPGYREIFLDVPGGGPPPAGPQGPVCGGSGRQRASDGRGRRPRWICRRPRIWCCTRRVFRWKSAWRRCSAWRMPESGPAPKGKLNVYSLCLLSVEITCKACVDTF